MRRRLAVGASLAAVVLVAVILVSGSQAMVGGSVPNAAQKAAVTTVTLTGWASSPAETDALKATVAGFERTHSSINVNYAPINGDYPASMLA